MGGAHKFGYEEWESLSHGEVGMKMGEWEGKLNFHFLPYLNIRKIIILLLE